VKSELCPISSTDVEIFAKSQRILPEDRNFFVSFFIFSILRLKFMNPINNIRRKPFKLLWNQSFAQFPGQISSFLQSRNKFYLKKRILSVLFWLSGGLRAKGGSNSCSRTRLRSRVAMPVDSKISIYLSRDISRINAGACIRAFHAWYILCNAHVV
jgi:hypothetical protein